MTQLSAAESRFFDSGGTDVDASLAAPSEVAPSEPNSAPAATPAAPAAPASGGVPASPAAPTAPAAAPPAGPAPADPGAPPAGFVPQAALHAERQSRQQMERQFRELQQQMTQMQQFLQQSSQPAEEPRPDPQQDPYGALEWDNRQIRAQLEQLTQGHQQTQQATQRQQQVQRLTQHLVNAEQHFAQTQQDYFQAADFAMKQEERRLQAFYPDPNVRRQVMQQEIANVVARAIQSGTSPAQIIYQHALDMGYTRAAAPAPGGAAAPAGGGAAAPAAPVIPPTVTEAQAAIQRGLEQQSRAGGGGSTPNSEMTPSMMLAMNGEEFQKEWDKQFGKRRSR